MGKRKRSQALHNWVEATGGAVKAAKLLGVTPHAVRVWLRGECFPRAQTLQKIERLSSGRLSTVTILASISDSRK